MPQYPYENIGEVRNCGRRRANRLLHNGWILLDWKSEHHLQQRTVRDANDEPQPMWFKIKTIQYILGRPRLNTYTSGDLEADEKRERDEEYERRRAEAAVVTGEDAGQPALTTDGEPAGPETPADDHAAHVELHTGEPAWVGEMTGKLVRAVQRHVPPRGASWAL